MTKKTDYGYIEYEDGKRVKLGPDDCPELGADWFKKAKQFKDLPKDLQAGLLTLKKPGRPKSAQPKKPISFRFSADIVDHLKEDVVAYNSRVEAVLREAIEQGRI